MEREGETLEEPRKLRLPDDNQKLVELEAGQEVRLSGVVFTMRDAGHERALACLERDGVLPFDLAGQTVFYAGPTPSAAGRPLGSVGPTTASRMDFATPRLFEAGIAASIGKGKRGHEIADACARFGTVHFTAVGGVAALLAKCVKSAETIAWDDLGTEALVKLEIEDFPAFVAIDARGNDVFAR